MANVLPTAKRAQILKTLCQGVSMRGTAELCDVSMNAVVKILADAGEACMWAHDDLVVNVKASKIQCDEVWSFTYAKQKNVQTAKAAPENAGDAWTWTAIDADSKLIVSYFVGDRSGQSARTMLCDLEHRLANRVQLTTDGYLVYMRAVHEAFGNDVDYAMLDKIYGTTTKPRSAEARYSPAPIVGTKVRCCSGNPDPKHVSTSYVERSNLSLRMHNRRFTRLTNAFSKRFKSHVHMVALYTLFYNFVRIHKTLRVTPAMQAGIADTVWTFEDVVAKIDYYAPPPKPRGPYKKRSK
jgi:IS1 family transposase